MRKTLLAIAVGLAIVTTGPILPSRLEAMPLATPGALSAAIAQTSVTHDTAWHWGYRYHWRGWRYHYHWWGWRYHRHWWGWRYHRHWWWRWHYHRHWWWRWHYHRHWWWRGGWWRWHHHGWRWHYRHW